MKKLLCLAAAFALLLPFCGVIDMADAATPPSPLGALGAYLGQWSGDGKILDTPYSKAASVGGITDCNWSPNHGYLVCDQKVQTPAGPSNDLSIYTYDEKEHTYQFFGLSRNNGNVRRPKLTIAGNRWIYSSAFDDNSGKHVQVRTTNEFTSATTLNFKTEYSLDGAHWLLMVSGSSHRVK